MSNVQVADFTKRAKSLSYDETLFVISILLERLKSQFEEKEKKSNSAFLKEIFDIAEKEPELHKSDKAWNRDELYRY